MSMLYVYLQEINENEDQELITDEERSPDALRATSQEQQQERESSVRAEEGNATDSMVRIF